MANLVIVESPSKASTIKGYLGSNYKVVASVGHVRDLPKSTLGVDIENHFQAHYINIRGKGDLIKEIRKEAKAAGKVFLATDPDREGEAISWHLANALGIPVEQVQRVTFNEITKSVVKASIKQPRPLDMNLVNAQQTRRILDRIVGYKLSPYLWKTVRSGLSAGRVQSVATKLIVDRENEIRAFVPEEYWTVDAVLLCADGKSVRVRFVGNREGKVRLTCEADARRVVDDVTGRNLLGRIGQTGDPPEESAPALYHFHHAAGSIPQAEFPVLPRHARGAGTVRGCQHRRGTGRHAGSYHLHAYRFPPRFRRGADRRRRVDPREIRRAVLP